MRVLWALLAVVLLARNGGAGTCGQFEHWPPRGEVYVVETLEKLPTMVIMDRPRHGDSAEALHVLYTPLEFRVERVLRGSLRQGAVDTLYWRGGEYLTPEGRRDGFDVSSSVALKEGSRWLILAFPFANGYTMSLCTTNRVPVTSNDAGAEGIYVTSQSLEALTVSHGRDTDSEGRYWVSLEELRRLWGEAAAAD